MMHQVSKPNRRASAPAAVPKKRPAAAMSAAAHDKDNVRSEQRAEGAAAAQSVPAGEAVKGRQRRQSLVSCRQTTTGQTWCSNAEAQLSAIPIAHDNCHCVVYAVQPAGFTPSIEARQTKVLDSIAHLIRLQTNNKNVTSESKIIIKQ